MFGRKRQVFVYNKSKETFLAMRVAVADSVSSRLIGLLGRRTLEPDAGVWIVPANSVHTIGMMFSFDLIMVDMDFRVVNVKEMVKPFRIVLPKLRAESVIELPVHTIFRSRTEVGDQLIIDRYEAKKAKVPQPAALIVSNSGKLASPSGIVTPLASEAVQLPKPEYRSPTSPRI
ncbi:MAG TPA: DUF192 domain-containing protein [Candidatus Sulfotelmatobacter sp.]|nr:DUF192 domain-containing protein [Candidatus Sulfotelmatobacter sp.]